MTTEEAVKALDAIDGNDDPEVAHVEADRVLYTIVPPEVQAAYDRVLNRTRWWATA